MRGQYTIEEQAEQLKEYLGCPCTYFPPMADDQPIMAAYRQALSFITKEDVAKKLFDQIGPKYATRDGGYTRVVRIGPRRGDAAEMAVIQLV